MKHRIITFNIALALGLLAFAATSVASAQTVTEPQVQASLATQGYTKVHDLKFTDGMWHAKARSADDKHVDVRIDAKTGQIYPDDQVSKLSKRDVRASLETQGYTKVHDVDFDHGVWKAKAKSPYGEKLKLRVDADTGKVIGTD